jgi:hypothetical protein
MAGRDRARTRRQGRPPSQKSSIAAHRPDRRTEELLRHMARLLAREAARDVFERESTNVRSNISKEGRP